MKMLGCSVQQRLRALQARMVPLERLLDAFTADLGPPLAYHSGQVHFGFRYAKPDERHFCLLKCARAVSALNGALVLAEQGYCQEIAVLIRTSIECTTHVKYVLDGSEKDGRLKDDVKKYLEEYFADFARNSPSDFKRTRIRQGEVHDVVGDDLKSFAPYGQDPSRLMSNVYLTFSNYVHARYPEVMDMYGGIPGHFHFRGMAGTPKDFENLAIIDEFITDVSNTMKLLVLQLKMKKLLGHDKILGKWFDELRQ
ncbi:MAG: hypothetical protein ABR929_10320 [Roseiarcus sp.]